MADQDRDRDNSDLTPFWELVHPDNSEHDSVSTHSLTRLAQTLDLILFTDHAGGPMSHLVLVSGSRAFPSPDLVKHRIRTALTPGDRLMHGCARGVDTRAEEAARAVGATILRRPADWDRYGKRAGMIRNADMFNEARRAGDFRILIFWDGISLGTKNMIDRCVAAGLPHEVIRSDSASS